MSGYLRRLALAVETGTIEPGMVAAVQVLHDEGCEHRERGVCTCHPELVLEGRDTEGRPVSFRIDDDGQAVVSS